MNNMTTRNIYPITLIENVINEKTGDNLYVFLSQFNHINVGYVANKEDARNLIPEVLRKQGLYITYYLNDNIITEYFDGNKNIINENDNWIKDTYWKQVNNFIAAGITENRPTDIPIGTSFFDTTINKCVWWNGNDWVTYPDYIKVIIKIKHTDIINTHRRVVDLIDIETLPNEIITVAPTFDKIVKVGFYNGDFYLIDAEDNYYHDTHNIETAHIFVKKEAHTIIEEYSKKEIEIPETYYYLEEDKSLIEITQDNIDNYILPIFGTKCPEFATINPYANGEYFIVDKGYEVVQLIAFPNKFYGRVIEQIQNAE
jgi:hypothetical protein